MDGTVMGLNNRHWTCLAVVCLAAMPAAGQQALPAVSSAIEQMAIDSGSEVEVTISRGGLATFVRAQRDTPVPVKGANTEERGAYFLARYGDAFGLGGAVRAELVRDVGADRVGMQHLRYRQTWQGIPVTGGEISVHLNRRGVVAVNANTVANLATVVTTPSLAADAALARVHDLLANDYDMDAAVMTEPRLELLNRGLLGHRSFSTELTWFVEVRGDGLREYVWVDALYGKVAFRFSQLTDAKDRVVHDTAGSGTLPGPLVRSEGDPASGDTDVDLAYDYSGDTYDYFWNQHGRDSFDGAGATLISTVDYCEGGSCPYNNAFWNGVQMVYGAGFPAADDVVGHELTHAVTEHTANLFYYMQSGALNESYSDVFGETIDLTNSGGTDTAGVRWQLGEDVPGFGAIRDMEDPTVFGDPGKVSDTEFFCGDDYNLDGGGVHFNSGVNNRAYSLAVDGGSYNGETVTGIGLTKAGKIWYRALSTYLLSSSDFLDNYNAVNQACQDLIGLAGITASDCTEVGKSLDAVEMNDPWPCTPPQAAVPNYCSGVEAPIISSFLDFEAVPLTACPGNTVPPNWCNNGPGSLLGPFATDGVESAWGYNKGTAGSQILTITTPGMLPANSFLQFDHSHGFENNFPSGGAPYYDGGIIEYSTDGGSSWHDLGPSIVAGDTYGGTLSTCCSNPLGGSSAFVGDSWGYTATQVDLSAHGGSSFRFRYNLGTDSSFDEYGWFIDDIIVYSCAECVSDRFVTSVYNGTADLYKASNSITAGSGFLVGLAEDVRFEAGNRVVLQDGFSVGGGDFAVSIQSCP